MFKFDGYTKLVEFKNIENESIQEVHGKNIHRSKRKCIFCGNENAKFTKVAHAVSETIGNKSLISHFECDECNQNFGKMFEDDLGKYMLPYKIITKTFGKKNQLSSKDMPKEHGISYGNYRIQLNRNKPVLENIDVKSLIIEAKNTEIIKLDDNKIEISIPRQHYFPPSIYCSFLKMAYSIMPLNLYRQYVKHIVILQQLVSARSIYKSVEQKKEIMCSMENCEWLCFFSGQNPLNGVNVILWEKLDLKEREYPRMLFTLEMKNYSFTIPVLADDEQGVRKMPGILSNMEVQYRPLDLRNEEKIFNCEMTGKIIDITDYKLLEDELRKNNLLK